MSWGLLQEHQSLAQEQRLQQPPCSSLSRPDENCAGGSNKKGRRTPVPKGSGLETMRPVVLGTGSIQDPWRTHLAIHRLRHSTSWKVLPLPKAGLPASAPRVPLEEGTDGWVPPNQDLQKGPARPPVTPTPMGAPQAGPRGVSHYPFPKRKAPRISEAARGLGLYRPPGRPPAGWGSQDVRAVDAEVVQASV